MVTSQFESLARSISEFEGYPNLPMVVVPHPFTTLRREEVEELADEFMDEILGSLTAQSSSLDREGGR